MNRRNFITKCALGVAGFQIVSRHILGGKDYTAANDRINVAIIGCGGIAGLHTSIIKNDSRLRCVSLCDVIKGRREKLGSEHFPEASLHNDFREIMNNKDVDIIHIATPPHWHAAMVVAAARAGKDIFAEKPMSRTIGELPVMCKAVKNYKRIFRINTWFRIGDTDYYEMGSAKKIKKLCMHQLLGWPLKVNVYHGSPVCRWKYSDWGIGKLGLEPQPIPEGTDYDMWLGPAKKHFYNEDYILNFRGYWDFDGGVLADMGQHFLDPIQYFLGKDNELPVEVEPEVIAPSDPDVVTVNWKKIVFRYADGCEITVRSELADDMDTSKEIPFIEGPEGKLFSKFRTDPESLTKKVDTLTDPPAQNDDFVNCVRDRKPFALNEDSSMHSMMLVHLGNTAIRTGEKLKFDPEKWQFIDNPKANLFVNQSIRPPWNEYV